jgi:hypothetical protein
MITMVDLSDPIYEFLRNDPVFLMDLYEDHVDPATPWSFAGTRERDQLAGALRELADLLTSRHDLPIPKDGYVRLDVIADGGRRVAEIEHGSGGYLFKVLPGAFEQPAALGEGSGSAARLAATDTPLVPSRTDPGPRSAAIRQQRSPQPGAVRRTGRTGRR